MLKELLEKYIPKTMGFVSHEEHKLIIETLHIKEMSDIISLRNLRDFTVIYMAQKEDIESWDKMSAITHVIDTEILNRGGEV